MNEVEDVQPGHIYQPGNKKEVRLVYRILSGPYCGRHQKSFSLTKWGPAGAWAAAREAKAFMLDTGRLPPFFASPYSRSRLTNASANGVSRGLQSDGGIAGGSDSDELPAVPPSSQAASSASRQAPAKRTQRARGQGPLLPPPAAGAAAACTAAASFSGVAAATAIEALLSLRESKETVLPTLPRERNVFPDAAALQLLALGCQQQQQQQAAAAASSSLASAAGCHAAANSQTALDLATLSLLSAGYPLKTEGQQQQQQGSALFPAQLLLQQLANRDCASALLEVVCQAAAAKGDGQPAGLAATACMQQQQWQSPPVDAQLLRLPLQPLLSSEPQEPAAAASRFAAGQQQQELNQETSSPLCSLECSSVDFNNSGRDQSAEAAATKPSRDPADGRTAKETPAAPHALCKETESLLGLLAAADLDLPQQQQPQLQQQQGEDMLTAMSSFVSLLESMQKQDTRQQPLGAAPELLSALAKLQKPLADPQQTEGPSVAL